MMTPANQVFCSCRAMQGHAGPDTHTRGCFKVLRGRFKIPLGRSQGPQLKPLLNHRSNPTTLRTPAPPPPLVSSPNPPNTAEP